MEATRSEQSAAGRQPKREEKAGRRKDAMQEEGRKQERVEREKRKSAGEEAKKRQQHSHRRLDSAALTVRSPRLAPDLPSECSLRSLRRSIQPPPYSSRTCTGRADSCSARTSSICRRRLLRLRLRLMHRPPVRRCCCCRIGPSCSIRRPCMTRRTRTPRSCTLHCHTSSAPDRSKSCCTRRRQSRGTCTARAGSCSERTSSSSSQSTQSESEQIRRAEQGKREMSSRA